MVKRSSYPKRVKLWLQIFVLYLKRVGERIRRNKNKIFIVLFPALFVLAGVVYLIQSVPSKPTLIEGTVGTYTEDNLPLVVTRLLSTSLITMDMSGKPQPNLAESWGSNEEANIYTVKLKDDLYWVDGSKITASDLDFSFPGVQFNPKDERTLEFKLTDSYSPFLSLLDKPIFKKGTRIGIGPYKIKKIKKDSIFVSKIFLESDKEDLPNIVITFYDSEKAAKTAFELGEVEALIGLNDLAELKNQKTVRSWSKTNYQQIVTVFYNTADKVLSDTNLRLALSFAAPSILNETEAKTSIPPTSWAFNPDVRDYLDNKEMAKTYLDKVQNSKDAQITLTATTFLQSVGEKVIESWKKQGIKAVLRIESGIPQNFQALLITQNIPADPDQYSLWHSTQKQTNVSKIESKRIDKDLEDGRKIADLEVRKKRYEDFQKVLLDEAPATFLYFPKINAVYRVKSEDEFKKVINLQIP